MRPTSTAHQEGIVALNAILQFSGSGSKTTGHDPASIYCKWAYNIANSPKEMPYTSVEKALLAFNEWRAEPPAGLIEKAQKLKMNKPDGQPY